MKKIILFLFLLISIISNAADDYYHKWSMSVDCGLSKFDCDVNQTESEIIPKSVSDIVYGAQVEYSFSPVCGLLLNYYHLTLRASAKDYLKIRTISNTSSINGYVNLTKLLIPNTVSKLSLIGAIGIGYSKYDFNTTGIFNPSPQGTIAGKVEDTYGASITLPVSFSLEYEISKNIDLGFKLSYIAFNKDNMEGVYYYNEVGGKTVYKGVTNDYVGLGTLYLKYKIPIKQSKKETINSDIYSLSKNDSSYIKNNKTYITNNITYNIVNSNNVNSVINSNNTNSNNTNSNNTNSNNVNCVINSNNIIYQDNIKDGCKTCTDSLKYSDTNGTDDEFIDSIPSIYFDFDKYNLDYKSKQIIKKIALFLNFYSEYYLEIRGYCDYMGDVPYNQQLSLNRANEIKLELIKYYNVPKNKIIINGLGKIDEPPMESRNNRRCDFFFYKVK